MKKFFAMSAMAMLALFGFAATPTITDVTAQQRYPWNGKVDISYTVTGDFDAEAARGGNVVDGIKITALDTESNLTYVATKLSGDTGYGAGTHNCVWDFDAQGIVLKSTNVVFSVSCEQSEATYCVIDLHEGSTAENYPVTCMNSIPGGSWANEYKTTKLVLKRCPQGTYKMQNTGFVTLTKSFFIGVFEVTQKQWSLVTGSNPCSSTTYGKGDNYPVHYVSYDMIRGANVGTNWPSSSAVDLDSFIGKLQSKTGLNFDLPTEAQWEYACRAGTTTTYSFGNSANDNYMWSSSNASTSKTVGTKPANPWGLYDMHGNVWEWCLDWCDNIVLYGTDPTGIVSGKYRATRGGSWKGNAVWGTSSYRGNRYEPRSIREDFGFRLSRTLE